MNKRGSALSEARKRRVDGFTLIELLISIVLMVILLSAVTMIFINTTETVATSQARTQVYTQARYALDMLESDLLGCLSFTSGQQRFCMDNGEGKLGKDGAERVHYTSGGGHCQCAADRLIFRTTTTIANTVQTAEITYELVPGNMALNLHGVLVEGDPSRGKTLASANFPDGRPLYTLVRRARVFNPATANYDEFPKDALGVEVNDMELCTFITSFNLEYFASNNQFSQLDPSYFRSDVPPGGKADPLGNGKGENDGEGSGGVPMRVPQIRVTLDIVEDIKARQERTIQKVVWIPMG